MVLARTEKIISGTLIPLFSKIEVAIDVLTQVIIGTIRIIIGTIRINGNLNDR